jgi:hypothetical protein
LGGKKRGDGVDGRSGIITLLIYTSLVVLHISLWLLLQYPPWNLYLFFTPIPADFCASGSTCTCVTDVAAFPPRASIELGRQHQRIGDNSFLGFLSGTLHLRPGVLERISLVRAARGSFGCVRG